MGAHVQGTLAMGVMGVITRLSAQICSDLCCSVLLCAERLAGLSGWYAAAAAVVQARAEFKPVAELRETDGIRHVACELQVQRVSWKGNLPTRTTCYNWLGWMAAEVWCWGRGEEGDKGVCMA